MDYMSEYGSGVVADGASTVQVLGRLEERPVFEETPKYIYQLAEAIRRSPSGHEVKIGQVGEDWPSRDIGRVLESIRSAGDSGSRRHIEQVLDFNQDLGLNITDDQVVLSPVDIVDVLDRRQFPLMLEHDGYVRSRGVDNIAQVLRRGVFGNVSSERVTYVRVFGSWVAPSAQYTSKDRALLYIDPVILSQYRSIFTDPEMFLKPFVTDKIGEGYVVLGGIPTRAIVGVAANVRSQFIVI